MKIVRLVLVLAVTLIGATSTSGRALPAFDALFAFGDSLSDIGNDYIGTRALGIVPAIPPAGSYYNGRFSNGPVGVEYLWYLLSQQTPGTAGALQPFLASPIIPPAGGLSLAFGGAGTGLVTNMGQFSVPGLGGQVALFAAADRYRPAPVNSLYVVMSGSNDYLPSPAGEPPLSPAVSVDNIVKAVKGLYLTGARHIMVVNLPDLGAIPLVSGPGNETLAMHLSSLTADHNTRLRKALRSLHRPGLTLYPVEISGAEALLPTTLIPAPALAFLSSPAAAVCLFVNPATCPTLTPEQFQAGSAFFYWDAEHPSTTVHAAIGQHLFNQLQ